MEPERQIEKLLRAMAKKRGDQAGDALELRPAAREQLQREILRRTASKGGGGFFRFFSNLFSGSTPKLAFGLSVLVVAGLGVWLVLSVGRKQPPSTLAMNEDSFGKSAPAARREMAESPPPASPAPVVAENRLNSAPPPQMSLKAEAGADRKQSVADAEKFKLPASTGGIVAQNSPARVTQAASIPPAENAPSALFDARLPNGSLAGAAKLDKDATSKTVEAPAPGFVTNAVVLGATVAAAEPEAQKKIVAPQPPVFFRANRATVSDGVASFGSAAPAVSNSQRFRQTVPATIPHAAGALSVSPVLTSFQVVQNGQEIHVVDADGSVYAGSFTTPDQSATRGARRDSIGAGPAAVSTVQAEARRLPAQTYFFRVAGTNRNLNQNVVFSGNLIPPANVPQAQTSAASGGGGGGGYGPGIPDTSLLLNSRIAGKAVIGGQKEIEVNATAAP